MEEGEGEEQASTVNPLTSAVGTPAWLCPIAQAGWYGHSYRHSRISGNSSRAKRHGITWFWSFESMSVFAAGRTLSTTREMLDHGKAERKVTTPRSTLAIVRTPSCARAP